MHELGWDKETDCSDSLMDRLSTEGWAIIQTGLAAAELQSLRDNIFSPNSPGQRCLLDHPLVRKVAISLRTELIESKFLPVGAVAIQAIAFDKTPGANWKVTWHQDVMFPFANPVTSPGFELPSFKEGIAYARPPLDVLESLLAVRLHLDDCDENNGPLRVATGSHRSGVLKNSEIGPAIERYETVTCFAKAGEALLMKPLLLHASSPATTPTHRRILHLVYHTGQPISEFWHRSIS